MYSQRNSLNKLYVRWLELRRRCRTPRQESYEKKNISWSKEFDTFEGFSNWALLNGFNESLSLDRIDNSLGYSAENCKWSTRKEQQYNQHKKTISNATSKYRGVSLHKKSNKWRSRIYINGKETSLGMFFTAIEAAIAYNNKLDELEINAPRNTIS